MSTDEALAPATAALGRLREAARAQWQAEVDSVHALLELADSYQVDELFAEDAAAAISDRLPVASSDQAWPASGDAIDRNLRWLCLEVGAALAISPASAGYRISQALALRDRHPGLWAAVQAGRLRLWQTREVIARCAHLSETACRQVDKQVARWCGQIPWTRMVKAVDSAVLAADPDAARQRRDVESSRRFVSVGGITDGHVDLTGRLSAGDGIALDQALDGIADAYLDPVSPWRRCVASVQQARAVALGDLARTALGQDTLLVAGDPAGGPSERETDSGSASGGLGYPTSNPEPESNQRWLRRPGAEHLRHVIADEKIELRRQHARTGLLGDQDSPLSRACPGQPRPPVAPRSWRLPPIARRATLVIHLSADSLANPDGLARVEGWGPILADQLRELLGDARITVRPIASSDPPPVDSYEIPDRHRFAVTQRNPVEVFPYGTRPARSCDLDHTVPWPRGDTSVSNLGPLSRTAHLAKTLQLWSLEQPASGVFVWRSPLNQRYLVTSQGSLALPENVTVSTNASAPVR